MRSWVLLFFPHLFFLLTIIKKPTEMHDATIITSRIIQRGNSIVEESSFCSGVGDWVGVGVRVEVDVGVGADVAVDVGATVGLGVGLGA
jgi:hypothetical protein